MDNIFVNSKLIARILFMLLKAGFKEEVDSIKWIYPHYTPCDENPITEETIYEIHIYGFMDHTYRHEVFNAVVLEEDEYLQVNVYIPKNKVVKFKLDYSKYPEFKHVYVLARQKLQCPFDYILTKDYLTELKVKEKYNEHEQV